MIELSVSLVTCLVLTAHHIVVVVVVVVVAGHHDPLRDGHTPGVEVTAHTGHPLVCAAFPPEQFELSNVNSLCATIL